MERNYKLYVHIAPNGKKYYGITKMEPEQRWKKGHGYDTQYFARAINKYGWDNIEHIVIYDDLTEDEAKELEQYYIQWYNTTNRAYGYNISLGGESGNHSEETRKKLSESHKGKALSEEAKQKLSKFHKGKIVSEETRRKLSEINKGENNYWFGKQLSKETKQKMSEAHMGENNHFYGKTHTEETKKKMSEAKKGKYTGKDHPKSRNIICITTNSVFNSLTEGAKYYNVCSNNISRCCNGKLKSAGKLPDGTKLVWKYIDIIEL